MTQKRVILPLPKSCVSEADLVGAPWIKRVVGGRYGKLQNQDWVAVCHKAVAFQKETGANILVIGDVKQPNWPVSEEDILARMIKSLGGSYSRYVVGHDTISQLEEAITIATGEDAELAIIVAPTHWLRCTLHIMLWKRRGEVKIPVTIQVGWGIPRPMEAVSDLLVVTWITLLLDLIGLKKCWVSFLRKKRKKS